MPYCDIYCEFTITLCNLNATRKKEINTAILTLLVSIWQYLSPKTCQNYSIFRYLSAILSYS